MDASGSVGLEKFSREKNFVKLVSRRFAATSPDTRLGLIVFSDRPNLFVDFGDFERKTIDQFQATVDQVPFQGGRSRIDLALRATSQDLFTNRRSGVPRVSENDTGIFLFSGCQRTYLHNIKAFVLKQSENSPVAEPRR